MRLAVGIDFRLVAAQGELATEIGHLLVVADGLNGLSLLALDRAETVQKEETIRFLGITVVAIRVG